jgi:hypothetical protein
MGKGGSLEPLDAGHPGAEYVIDRLGIRLQLKFSKLKSENVNIYLQLRYWPGSRITLLNLALPPYARLSLLMC